MCFIKEKKRHSIAKEDIVCYKIVYRDKYRDCYLSEYMGFIYKLGETYKENSAKILALLDERDTLNCGVFHSYKTLKPSILHPWRVSSHAIKCIIPKGACYWVNNYRNEYASTAIKVVEEVAFKEIMDIIFE